MTKHATQCPAPRRRARGNLSCAASRDGRKCMSESRITIRGTPGRDCEREVYHKARGEHRLNQRCVPFSYTVTPVQGAEQVQHQLIRFTACHAGRFAPTAFPSWYRPRGIPLSRSSASFFVKLQLRCRHAKMRNGRKRRDACCKKRQT